MEEIYLNKWVKHNGTMFQIIRKMPHHQFLRKDGTIIAEKYNAWKFWLEADHVFKTKTDFLFCETVPDLEYEMIAQDTIEP